MRKYILPTISLIVALKNTMGLNSINELNELNELTILFEKGNNNINDKYFKSITKFIKINKRRKIFIESHSGLESNNKCCLALAKQRSNKILNIINDIDSSIEYDVKLSTDKSGALELNNKEVNYEWLKLSIK
ncbi:hypothetical protein CPAV1605_1302 [seawater metagenome]|uniref:OmpA-like domain-containing protein n=1 Tax=seawater metagenome TaxID=1561972 RepID=A0A5E8CMI5_9ZZZZ